MNIFSQITNLMLNRSTEVYINKKQNKNKNPVFFTKVCETQMQV